MRRGRQGEREEKRGTSGRPAGSNRLAHCQCHERRQGIGCYRGASERDDRAREGRETGDRGSVCRRGRHSLNSTFGHARPSLSLRPCYSYIESLHTRTPPQRKEKEKGKRKKKNPFHVLLLTLHHFSDPGRRSSSLHRGKALVRTFVHAREREKLTVRPTVSRLLREVDHRFSDRVGVDALNRIFVVRIENNRKEREKAHGARFGDSHHAFDSFGIDQAF